MKLDLAVLERVTKRQLLVYIIEDMHLDIMETCYFLLIKKCTLFYAKFS